VGAGGDVNGETGQIVKKQTADTALLLWEGTDKSPGEPEPPHGPRRPAPGPRPAVALPRRRGVSVRLELRQAWRRGRRALSANLRPVFASSSRGLLGGPGRNLRTQRPHGGDWEQGDRSRVLLPRAPSFPLAEGCHPGGRHARRVSDVAWCAAVGSAVTAFDRAAS
jgi:hypothetical protein